MGRLTAYPSVASRGWPPPWARVDRSHPLGAGLQCLALPAAGIDVASQRPLSGSAGGAWRATRFGSGVHFNATAGMSVTLDLTDATEFTVASFGQWNAFASDDDLLCEFSSNTNATPPAFFVNPNDSGGNFTVRWRTIAAGNQVYSVPRPTTRQSSWVLAVPLNGAPDVWFDGVAQTTTLNFSATNTGTYNSNTLFIGSRGATSLRADMDLAALMVWRRRLSAAEAHALHVDPYQMLVY